MARALRHIEALLDQRAADRSARAARHALLMCALAFGRCGGGEREVLFAVARSYTAAARDVCTDERRASDVLDVADGQVVRRLLGRAEDTLCAAAEALPYFSCHAVRRLVRAARAYAHAWELDRASAVRRPQARATSTHACTRVGTSISKSLGSQQSPRHS